MASVFKPPNLDLSLRRYDAWLTWKRKWDDYVIVAGLADKDEPYKCAILRYTFSEETTKIYESLTLSEDDKKSTAAILKELEAYAKGIVNQTLERLV